MNKYLITLGFFVLTLGSVVYFFNSVQLHPPLPTKVPVNQTQEKGNQATTVSPTTYLKKATPGSVAGNKMLLVTRVVDGDTIEVETGQKVRYIGINTPESVDPRTAVQCFGKEAAAENKRLVEGKKVRLEKDVSETDKYGRLLRYVYLPQDGKEIFINQYLVTQGFAQVSTYPPDIKYQQLFLTAQKEAQAKNLGLWSGCGSAKVQAATTIISGCNIKGNISSSGEKIYHLPDQKYYNSTVIDTTKGEKYFCSTSEAQAAGFRASKI